MPSHLLPRLGLLMLGIVLLSLAISLSIRSEIGTSPVSSLPYVYSIITSFSVGLLTILMQLIMIVGQILILGKDFRWIQWLQLPASIVFGITVDGMLWLTQYIQPDLYISKMMLCLTNCFITAIAVCLMVKANLIVMAVDALYLAICKRWGFNFGRCKMWGDISLVLIASLSIWLAAGHIVGIGEGTLISAILVGTLIRYFMPLFDFINFNHDKMKSNQLEKGKTA